MSLGAWLRNERRLARSVRVLGIVSNTCLLDEENHGFSFSFSFDPLTTLDILQFRKNTSLSFSSSMPVRYTSGRPRHFSIPDSGRSFGVKVLLSTKALTTPGSGSKQIIVFGGAITGCGYLRTVKGKDCRKDCCEENELRGIGQREFS